MNPNFKLHENVSYPLEQNFWDNITEFFFIAWYEHIILVQTQNPL